MACCPIRLTRHPSNVKLTRKQFSVRLLGGGSLPAQRAMTISVVTVDFSDILAELEADKDLQETIREHQKDLDRSSRSIATVLNKIHSTPSQQSESSNDEGWSSAPKSTISSGPLQLPLSVHSIVEQTVPLFAHSRNAVRSIVSLVPDNQYYKVGVS
jgi:hypothetical protein